MHASCYEVTGCCGEYEGHGLDEVGADELVPR